jgi:hypothetical protein
MAHEEGFRRLKLIARFVLFVGASLIAMGIVLGLLSYFLKDYPSGWGPLLGIFCVAGIYLIVLGGILSVAVWVVEGFVRGPKLPGSR